jgi:hypothetical protein
MDQCSRHDIPPAVRGDLTDQQGHNLELELEALATVVLTCWWLGDQLYTRRARGGRSPLENLSCGRVELGFNVPVGQSAGLRMPVGAANPIQPLH